MDEQHCPIGVDSSTGAIVFAEPASCAPEPLTSAKLDEIEARTNAATHGPWVTHKYTTEADTVRQAEWTPCGEPDHSDCGIAQAVHDISVSLNIHSDGRAKKNAEFIAHAREDIPTLITEIRRLNRLIEEAGPHRVISHTHEYPCCLDTREMADA
jgi:hypothetical protein